IRDRGADVFFQTVVLNKRDEKSNYTNRSNQADGGQKYAPEQIHPRTEAAGGQGNAVLNDHVIEQSGQEYPLRNFARGSDTGCNWRRTEICADAAEDSRCASIGTGPRRFHLWSGRGHHVFDDDRAHAGKVEAPEKGIDTQLAGTSQIHKKLHY